MGMVFRILCCGAVVLTLVASRDGMATVSVAAVTTPGGLSAWVSSDQTSPVVSMVFSVPGGQTQDPAGLEGTAALAADLLTDGAGSRNQEQFQAVLQENAITLTTSVDGDRLMGILRFPLSSQKDAAALLKDVLYRPILSEKNLSKRREEMQIAFQNSEKTPPYKLGRLYGERIFKNHPYGRPPGGTAESLKKIQRRHIQDYLKKVLRRDGLVVALCGDMNGADAARFVDDIFGGLPKGLGVDPVPHAPTIDRAMVARGAAPGFPQSVAMIAQDALPHTHPDFKKLMVINQIFGGGMTSRLWQAVRDQRGLAYGVGTRLPHYAFAHQWIATVSSANDTVDQAIHLMVDAWKTLKENGITAAELADAQSFLTGSYSLNFTSSIKIAHALHSYQVIGYPIDYMDKRNDEIQKLTVQDINDCIGRVVAPERLAVLVVGGDGVAQKAHLTPGP